MLAMRPTPTGIPDSSTSDCLNSSILSPLKVGHRQQTPLHQPNTPDSGDMSVTSATAARNHRAAHRSAVVQEGLGKCMRGMKQW